MLGHRSLRTQQKKVTVAGSFYLLRAVRFLRLTVFTMHDRFISNCTFLVKVTEFVRSSPD